MSSYNSSIDSATSGEWAGTVIFCSSSASCNTIASFGGGHVEWQFDSLQFFSFIHSFIWLTHRCSTASNDTSVKYHPNISYTPRSLARSLSCISFCSSDERPIDNLISPLLNCSSHPFTRIFRQLIVLSAFVAIHRWPRCRGSPSLTPLPLTPLTPPLFPSHSQCVSPSWDRLNRLVCCIHRNGQLTIVVCLVRLHGPIPKDPIRQQLTFAIREGRQCLLYVRQ